MYYECGRCGWTGQADLCWSNVHVKATCPKCSGFIEFVKQSKMDYDDFRKLHDWELKQVSEEMWITATFADGSSEQVGEINLDSNNMPTELEINGITYRGEF